MYFCLIQGVSPNDGGHLHSILMLAFELKDHGMSAKQYGVDHEHLLLLLLLLLPCVAMIHQDHHSCTASSRLLLCAATLLHRALGSGQQVPEGYCSTFCEALQVGGCQWGIPVMLRFRGASAAV